MISFNTNDYNLSKVRIESKLFNLQTQNSYRIYGLKEEDNPPILITHTNSADVKILSSICEFFKNNGIEMEFESEENQEKDFYVGIRKDLRKHILLSASILQTIIYGLEGRVDLKTNYKIPGIPKFN